MSNKISYAEALRMVKPKQYPKALYHILIHWLKNKHITVDEVAIERMHIAVESADESCWNTFFKLLERRA